MRRVSRAALTRRAGAQDNTLTAPYAREVHPPLRSALADCLRAFDGAAVLLSNSAGLKQYDPDGEEADALAAQLGVPVLRHSARTAATRCHVSRIER